MRWWTRCKERQEKEMGMGESVRARRRQGDV